MRNAEINKLHILFCSSIILFLAKEMHCATEIGLCPCFKVQIYIVAISASLPFLVFTNIIIITAEPLFMENQVLRFSKEIIKPFEDSYNVSSFYFHLLCYLVPGLTPSKPCLSNNIMPDLAFRDWSNSFIFQLFFQFSSFKRNYGRFLQVFIPILI